MMQALNRNQQKWVVVLACLVFMVFGGGCITVLMWSQSDYKKQNFIEKTPSYLITQDHNKMVVLGEKYHYILNTPNNYKQYASTPLAKQMTVEMPRLTISTHDGEVKGNVIVSIDTTDLSESEIKQIEAWSFRKQKKGAKNYRPNLYMAYYFTNGQFYQKGNFKLSDSSEYLVSKQTINITMKTKKNRMVQKILLTPVALLADGVLIAFGIPLMLLSSAK